MTDFVDRLLGRGGAPPIRAAVPSLFEAAPPVTAEPPLPMGSSVDSTPGRQRTGLPRPIGGTVTVTGSPLPVTGAPVPQAPFDQVAAATPVDNPAQPAHRHPPSPGVEQARVAVTTAVEAAPTPTEHRATGPETGVTTAPAPWPEPVPVAGVLGPELLRPVAAPQGGHPVSAGAPIYPVVHPASPPTPATTRRALISQPDVHISIGRIEIKAATPPTAPRRAEQPGKPVLSLDDYLRGRAGGDRR